MNELAIRLINEAYEKKSTFLDLGNCGLRKIPKEILNLKGFLQHLNLGSSYQFNGMTFKSANTLSKNSIVDDEFSFYRLLGFQDLLSLSLNNNGVGEKGANIISKLSTLSSLSFENNSIGEKGAEYISKLSSLTSLYLDGNDVGDKGAEYISRLSSLISLDLSSNSITDIGMVHLCKLSSLISLNINSNEIGAKGAEHLSRLLSLKSLELIGNDIDEKGAEYISKLSSLNSLNLYSNNVGDKGAIHIRRLLALTSLNLGANNLKEKGVECISKLSSLITLNLSINDIGENGAEYISCLPLLVSLNLDYNSITQKGAEYISKLSLLTSLSLDGNNIGEKGAEYISKLSFLDSLNLNRNEIGDDGAQHISRLSTLTSLHLDDNDIKHNGAKHISKLSSLAELSLANNYIGEEGAKYIGNLFSLTSLNLDSNNIGDKGVVHLNDLYLLSELSLKNNEISSFNPNISNQIATLYLDYNLLETISLSLVKHIALEIDIERDEIFSERTGKIFLHGNPIKNPPFEVLLKGRSAIIEYLESNQRPLNECKMIFIGDGSVGKTSLMKRLVYKEFNKDEKTTHGINKIAWSEIKNEKEETIKINLWDFGGQHIQHSLHQFFFTERVVYILVLNPRNDEKAGYWLDQIDKLGRDSQIIIVYNWKLIEDKGADFLTNFRELRKTYKYLPEPIILSCATGDGIQEFEVAVKSAVLANGGLKTAYPETWFNIKEKLEFRIPIEKHYIKYPEYESWCEEEEYNDPVRRRTLLRILDSVGAIVFFDKPVLNELQVLNPEWISTGAYAILTSEITREKKGHLTWEDLCTIFSTEKEIFADKEIKIKYEEPQFTFILQLMQDYRLCQKNPLSEHEYLIPSAFGERPKKEYDIIDGGHYRLKFKSPFEMLIIHRFIAKNILNIISNDYWNSGMYFKHTSSETFALVETNLYSQEINCWIKGKNVRGMWEVIRNDFREIFNIYNNFHVDEEVEYRGVFLNYNEMITALKNDIPIIAYDPKTGLKNINVLRVLELFENYIPMKENQPASFEQIKIEVNPSITVSPHFINNPTPNINTIGHEQKKEQHKAPVYDFIAEDLMIKKWKNKSLFTFIFSLIITTLLIIVWTKKWILAENSWNWLEKHDAIKWIGIIIGIIWNSFIVKSLYDRFLDPSKVKAYRESLRK